MTVVCRYHYLALIALLLAAITTGISAATDEEALPSQAGLPLELVIAPQPPLDEQIATLESLAAYAQEHAPKGGFLAGLKGMFSGTKKPIPVDIPDLVGNAEALKGKLVAVEGIYETIGEERAAFKAQGGTCYVDLAGGTSPVGFRKAGPEGLPARAEGLVEIADDGLPVVRAQRLTAALALTHIRLARAYELAQDYEKAIESYQQGVKVGSVQQYQFAAFAACRAAEIALHQLGEPQQAKKLYNQAWNSFTKKRANGQDYYTWVLTDEAWEKQPVREVIVGPLDNLQRDGFWYKLVDLFALICGGNPAYGLLLLAVVTRVAIYPLTKKQLASSRAMQQLQPQIKELQNKYKDNKQKFQEEFWKLCKQNKVNPLGGCLPLLVQMPILIMIYRGIRDYIVRFDQAGFLWVRNLSQPDIVLLIAYTISMVAFQKMTQKMDPSAQINPQQQQQQQMMTWMMPLMFFFLFQSFPAAFILYWLGTNLVYFVMQYWYMKTTPAPAAVSSPGRQLEGQAASATGSGERPGSDAGKPPSYEEKKAEAQGKKIRKDEDSDKRKRRR